MARYRTKTEEDLAWNQIRRRITRDFDTVLQDFREEALNKLLGKAFDQFALAQEKNETIHLEEEATKWIAQMLAEKLRPLIEAANADLADVS